MPRRARYEPLKGPYCPKTVLRSGMTDVQVVSELLEPYDANAMRSYPVSTRINHVANDDEECSLVVEIAEDQKPLFS